MQNVLLSTANSLEGRSISDLSFDYLSKKWDEGIPLGNGVIGAVLWQKDGNLRFSLDRTDLWDLRPMPYFDDPQYTFEWVKEHIRAKNYKPVQEHFDKPYDQLAAPSKIPGAALEFSLKSLGTPTKVRLLLKTAVCEMKWDHGASLKTFVSATKPIGWFSFENVPSSFVPRIIMPQYEKDKAEKNSGPAGGQDIVKLGYSQGSVREEANSLVYRQKGYGGFVYEVAVKWKRVGKSLYGIWSISSSLSKDNAEQDAISALKRGFGKDFNEHLKFWRNYWAASTVSLPDQELQKQYDNDMYKLGSVTRSYGYPISLQSVWTADNGHLPPWKGDFHHDMNTEMSYWSAFEGNHLKEAMGFVNTLWNQQDVYKKYTQQYFGKGGMNIPGVCSLTGEPLGGWIQYAMSQTIGAWLAQQFYLQWKYSSDDVFLKTRAYPFMKEVATFLEQQTCVNPDGRRTFEFSSSPATHRNELEAWFPKFTNYDLALTKFAFSASSEMANKLSLKNEAKHWKSLENQLPNFILDEDSALIVAEGCSDFSYYHFSTALAICPLGLINWSDGPQSQKIIRSTLDKCWKAGTKRWWGATFAWMANLEALARNGDKAYEALKTFTKCFVSPNTFHLDGDQSGTGVSDYTDRSFTLEGNFAFASAIHKMLMQSHNGTVYIFPAIPSSWSNVSFRNLRAEGAFLISAEMRDRRIVDLQVYSEKGGAFSIASPVTGKVFKYMMKRGESKSLIDICSSKSN